MFSYTPVPVLEDLHQASRSENSAISSHFFEDYEVELLNYVDVVNFCWLIFFPRSKENKKRTMKTHDLKN